MRPLIQFKGLRHAVYDGLVKKARVACAARGHNMHPIRVHTYDERRFQGAAKCRNCPAWVQVDERPPANGIDIGGPAVALNCPADPRWC